MPKTTQIELAIRALYEKKRTIAEKAGVEIDALDMAIRELEATRKLRAAKKPRTAKTEAA